MTCFGNLTTSKRRLIWIIVLSLLIIAVTLASVIPTITKMTKSTIKEATTYQSTEVISMIKEQFTTDAEQSTIDTDQSTTVVSTKKV